jgi:hypothetical protein
VDDVLRILTNTGFRRGVGGSRPWLIAGMVAIGFRLMRRLASPPPDVIYRTALSVGDRFEVITRRP